MWRSLSLRLLPLAAGIQSVRRLPFAAGIQVVSDQWPVIQCRVTVRCTLRLTTHALSTDDSQLGFRLVAIGPEPEQLGFRLVAVGPEPELTTRIPVVRS